MNNIQKRFIGFLFGCIALRSFFVYLAHKGYKGNFLPLLGILALIPVIGWINILFFNPRETGAEVFGEKIWWNNLRPLHSLLYFVFAYNAINGNPMAWVYLLIDVIIGLTSFLSFHFYNGDFTPFLISNADLKY